MNIRFRSLLPLAVPALLTLHVLAVVAGTGPLAAQTTQDPVILLVPGYTLSSPGSSSTQKHRYFQDQRSYFTGLGRDVLYLNTPNPTTAIPNPTYRDFRYPQFDLGTGHDPHFNSDRTRIDLNADEIVAVLRRLRDMGRTVTIVSHSKGGQDVLHALVELDQGTQEPINRDLWPIVTGWLAFTSNFFEAKFRVHEETSPGVPCCLPNWGLPTTAQCAFRYSQYLVDPGVDFAEFMPRQQYMSDHRAAIEDLTANVRILCAYGAFRPVAPALPLGMDDFNMRIWTESHQIESRSGIAFCGANDGVVPVRAAQIPGARFSVLLPDDPSRPLRPGADHDSPAGSSPLLTWGIWTPPFRIEMTRHYIRMLESFRTFGSGCGGAAGTPKLDAHGDSVPFVNAGSRFTLELSSLPAGVPTAMMLGFSNQQWGSIALPFDLAALGAAGCFGLVSIDHFDYLSVANGVALWTVDIPLDGSLVGQRFYNQGLVLDASANAFGIALSNGGEAILTAR